MEALASLAIYRHAQEASQAFWLSTKRGSSIPVVWIRGATHKTLAKARLVVLHCHGNATDMGLMMGPYFELAKVLGVDVVGVEFSGYGPATGSPSEANTYADLEAAYDFLVELGVAPDRIVAYGQSIGSGPVAQLASRKPIGGLVLHSPLLSGIKVIDPYHEKCCRPSCVWRCLDFYPTYQRMKKLKCPALIMHGRRDEIIPFYHGNKLNELCSEAKRWPGYFPAKAGHNDLVEADPRRYFDEMSVFLRTIAQQASGEVCDTLGADEFRPRLSIAPRARRSYGSTEGVNQATPLVHPAEFLHNSTEETMLGAVGPTDGRYEQMRHGDLKAGTV